MTATIYPMFFVSAAAGDELWTNTASFVNGAEEVYVDQSNSYVICGELTSGDVTCLYASNGTEKWNNTDGDDHVLIITGDTSSYLYVGYNDGDLRKIWLSNGTTAWTNNSFGAIRGLWWNSSHIYVADESNITKLNDDNSASDSKPSMSGVSVSGISFTQS